MKENKNNSSLIRTDTFIYKIRKFFSSLFGAKNNEIKQATLENTANIETTKQVQEVRKSTFMEQIKVEDENKTEKIVKMIKTKKIQIEELTEEQKQEVILFLLEKVFTKKEKLKDFKNRILYKKLKKDTDISSVLSKVSQNDKANFLEFLKQQVNTKINKQQELNLKIAKNSNT